MIPECFFFVVRRFYHHHFVLCCSSYPNSHTYTRKYRLEDISPICWSYCLPLSPNLPPSFVLVCFGEVSEQGRKSNDGNGDPGYPFRSYYSSKLVNTHALPLRGSHYTPAKSDLTHCLISVN